MSDWHLSAKPKRESSLPGVGQDSACLPCRDMQILVLWVHVSSRAMCDVLDLCS